jgi:hypothetical protein
VPPAESQSLLLVPTVALTGACRFIAVFARTAKSQGEIKPLADNAHGGKTLSISLIN